MARAMLCPLMLGYRLHHPRVYCDAFVLEQQNSFRLRADREHGRGGHQPPGPGPGPGQGGHRRDEGQRGQGAGAGQQALRPQL